MRVAVVLIGVMAISTSLFADKKAVDRSNPWEMMFHPTEVFKVMEEALDANDQESRETIQPASDKNTETATEK